MTERNDYLIQENIVNIAIVAGHLLTTNRIEVEQSPKLAAFIIEKAKEFEQLFGEKVKKTEEYLLYIDEFAEKELIKRFGKEKQ
jgi:hypothetical protein